MAAWDGYAKQGDSINIIAVFPNTYGGFTTGLSATVTIAMDLAGSALVSGAAMTESTALPGIYYYAYTVPASGFIYAKATSTAGDSICTWVIGTGAIPDMATATALSAVDSKVDTVDGIVDAIKLKTDLLPADPVDVSDLSGLSTFNPAVTSVTVGINNDKTGYALTTDYDPAKTAASQSSVNVIDGIVDNILLDTNELQTNQGNWLTATGFSTFDPSVDLVKVGTNYDKTGYALANPDLCKADLTTTEANLATLLARLSATRAGYLDYIDDNYANINTLLTRLTDTRAAKLDNVSQFNAATDVVYANIDLSDLELDLNIALIHEAFNTYPDSLPPGVNPPVVLPPDNTDAVKIYAYCFAKDSNTILPECNGTLELLLSTEENGKHHKADPEAGTYYDDTGELFWLVPPYAKVRVQIPALKVDTIGYTGAGAETLRVDHLYKTPQVPV